MGRYRGYPEYRDSGVEWLGDIPSHWQVFDGKRIFKNRHELALDTDQQLAASQMYGVIPQALMMKLNDSRVMLALKGTSSFRHVEKNDYVISLRSFEGGIEHSDYDGCVSPAYTVLKPIKDISPRFYRYLFKCKPFISALQSSTDSLRDGKSITYDQFGTIVLVVPKSSEQTPIAAFLDHETAKIDALIEKQQTLIALLKEKRQAVISHAVTKGLNPDVPMKDSGVEWLGEVPEHWEIKRLKHLLQFVTSGSRGWAQYYSEEGELFFRIGNLTRDGIDADLSSIQYVSPPGGAEGERSRIKEDDLLISITADLGSVAVACLEIIGGYVSQHVALVRPAKTIGSARWLGYALISDVVKKQLHAGGYGGTKIQLSLEDIREIDIVLPPSEEQETLVSYIECTLKKFDVLTDKAIKAITIFQERRTALISAAVTGKIDVRHWKAPAHDKPNSVDAA